MNQEKKSQPQPESEESQIFPNFLDLESKVFTLHKGRIYIGKEEITSQLRSLLRDESRYILSSRMWEILNASVINEAYNLALIQSTDFQSVQFAKALKHWSFFLMNVMATLAKE